MSVAQAHSGGIGYPLELPGMKYRLLLPVLILTLACGLRISGLNDRNIWFDEGVSVWLARQPAAQLIDWTARDVHPPLYYLLLRGWWLLVGDGEFVLRYLSALLGVLAVALIYGLAKTLGGHRAGLLAMFLLAISRFAITWSQELRMHTLAAVLATIALWMAIRIWRGAGWRTWLLYVVSIAAGLYTFYLSISALVVANLAFPIFWWRSGRSRPLLFRWIAAQMIAAALFVPWAAYAFPRMHGWTTENEHFSALFGVEYYLVTLTVGVDITPQDYLPLALVCFAVLGIGVAAIGRSLRGGTTLPLTPTPSPRKDGEGVKDHLGDSSSQGGLWTRLRLKPAIQPIQPIPPPPPLPRLYGGRGISGLALLLLGLVLPALIVFALALPLIPGVARPLTPRYFLPLAACFYALLGWGIAALWNLTPSPSLRGEGAGVRGKVSTKWRFLPRLLATFGLAIVVIAALIGLIPFYPDRVRHDDYVSLASVLRSYRRSSDAVLLYSDRAWPIFAAQYAGDWKGIPYGMPMNAKAADWFLGPIWNNAAAIWLITTPDAQRADPTQAVRTWLDGHTQQQGFWNFGENTLTLYVRTPERAMIQLDTAPGFNLPANARHFADPLLGAWLPMSRYTSGDVVHLWLYWKTPPTTSFNIELFKVGSSQPFYVNNYSAIQAATSGPAIQPIEIALAPTFPGGAYQISLQYDAQTYTIGTFTLVTQHSAAVIDDTQNIQNRLNVLFGDSIELLGFDLASTQAQAGSGINVTLYWRAKRTIPERYKVSVYVLGDKFNPATNTPLWGQQDNEPVNWQYPTTQWVPGTIIADTYHVPLSAITPAGDYKLGVLMYGLVDGVRLPVTDTVSNNGTRSGDSYALTTLNMK